jgi:phospholipid/cholesterol/gamma-HCH transport system permease protein
MAVPGLIDTPLRALGQFFAMTLDVLRYSVRRPFQWGEFIDQCWFIARVSMVPTVLVALPFTVLVSFTLNILLKEIGAADLSGAGAGATAICADLGARTIRDEIAAMEVLGIDPVRRLVIPRVLASTFVALLLNGLVVSIGLLGGFFFSVFLQEVNPGAFVSGLTLLTHLPEMMISEIKAGLFGLIAGLVACYRGLAVKGGPKSVGDAVNETVVYSFMGLFVINVIVTAVGIKATAG